MNRLKEDFIKNEAVKPYYDILQHKKASLFLKRVLDIILSVILIIILFPVFIIIGLCILIDDHGRIFYKQIRVTKYGKQFKILKFRTMLKDADKIGGLITLENDKRITRVGKFLRKCHIDEIPQLFNVLSGNMSFVGTRPEVPKYVAEYTDEMMATLLLPAGVTGMASIKFKDGDEISANRSQEDIDNEYINIILPAKMQINLEYTKNVSVWYDIKIIFKTIKDVFVG